MATKLVIVESPTKAHKIGDYLARDTPSWHRSAIFATLRNPARCPWPINPSSASSAWTSTMFKPYYIVDGDKKRTVSELKSA